MLVRLENGALRVYSYSASQSTEVSLGQPVPMVPLCCYKMHFNGLPMTLDYHEWGSSLTVAIVITYSGFSWVTHFSSEHGYL